MLGYLGKKRPGSVLRMPFHTFDSNDPSGSVTLTGLTTASVKIYKDDSMTERSSANGITLWDTDGIDIDTRTGIHGYTIDLSDNTDAGFYTAGSQFTVVVTGLTVDSGTVNFVHGLFEIGQEGALLDTTIATLAGQDDFTITTGPTVDDALVGFGVMIQDIENEEFAFGVVSGYTGSTKTIALTDPAIFTMSAGDNISFFAPTAVPAVLGGRLSMTTAGQVALNFGDTTGRMDVTALPVPMEHANNATIAGHVASATNGTTFVIETLSDTDIVAESLAGRSITFTSASTTNQYSSRVILTHNTTTDEIQVGFSGESPGVSPFPEMPVANDPFVIA